MERKIFIIPSVNNLIIYYIDDKKCFTYINSQKLSIW